MREIKEMSDDQLNMKELREKYPEVKANSIKKFLHLLEVKQSKPDKDGKKEKNLTEMEKRADAEADKNEEVSHDSSQDEDKKKVHPLETKYKKQSNNFLKTINVLEEGGKECIVIVTGEKGLFKLLKYYGVGATKTLKIGRADSLKEFLKSI